MKKQSGETIEFGFFKCISVEHFKWHIHDKTGIPVEKQVLTIGGEELMDHMILNGFENRKNLCNIPIQLDVKI